MAVIPPKFPGFVLFLLLVGCSDCGEVGDLQVEGDYPFVRCNFFEAEEERSWVVGDISLHSSDRRLTIDGDSLRVAVVTGSAPGAAPTAEQVASATSGAQLLVVLGNVGDNSESIAQTLEAFVSFAGPTIYLLGGRDNAEQWRSALENESLDRDRIIDGTALDTVEVAGQQLVLWNGARGGRYARCDACCGYSKDDLDDRASALDEGGGRFVLSWQAPAGMRGAGLEGGEAGDPDLTEFIQRIAGQGGVFVWPGGPPQDRYLWASPIRGFVSEQADGSPVEAGARMLQISGQGVTASRERVGDPAN